MERRNIASYEDAYMVTKANTIAFINITPEQKPILKNLFKMQATTFQAGLAELTKKQSDASLHNLIKIMLQSEDDFRKTLSPEQMKLYTDKLNDAKADEDIFFKSMFLSDKEYAAYKKEAKL